MMVKLKQTSLCTRTFANNSCVALSGKCIKAALTNSPGGVEKNNCTHLSQGLNRSRGQMFLWPPSKNMRPMQFISLGKFRIEPGVNKASVFLSANLLRTSIFNAKVNDQQHHRLRLTIATRRRHPPNPRRISGPAILFPFAVEVIPYLF